MPNYKKFFLYNLLFIIFFFILFLSIYLKKNHIKYINSSNESIYIILKYQVDKISKNDKIENVFLGDSSLGNTINSDLFSELSNKKSLNLALSDTYGFGGQYNLLKSVHEKNKDYLKNIIIFISPFFLNRQQENEGFFLTSKDLYSFAESENKFNYILLSYKYYFKKLYDGSTNRKKNATENIIKNDFIIQKKTYDASNKFIFTSNNNEHLKIKKYYFEKIYNYCRLNKLNLIIINGPIEKRFYNENNDFFIKKDIFFNEFKHLKYLETIKKVDLSQIGDYPSHIRYSEKDQFTKEYFYEIKKYLK
jgi:hypothetical protein